MVEVFKTDVTDRDHATILVEAIHKHFPAYTANFDLADCDNILRIQSTNGPVLVPSLIGLLNELGCRAEVLPDEIPVISQLRKYALSRKPAYL